MADNTYDAIVVGSGISGGWAAKELTEKGLKVLMLERGEDIPHGKGYEKANRELWELRFRAGGQQRNSADNNEGRRDDQYCPLQPNL